VSKPKIHKKQEKNLAEHIIVNEPESAQIDPRLKVFIEDLNNLVESEESFHYLKERITKLGQIDDYKTITQFFRIMAFSLHDKLAKVKSAALSECKSEVEEKFNQMKDIIDQKNKEIEDLKKNIGDFKEEFIKLRSKSENINEEAADNVKKRIFLNFLPVIDNFTLAVKAKDESADLKTVCDGFMMIYEQLIKTFEKEGVKEVTCLGEKFDPKFHEVIQEIQDDTKERGIILEEIRKAYFYGDKLIRPAMVKIVK